MDNISRQRLHVIVDDTEENDDEEYIAPPVIYSSGRSSSFDDSYVYQPRETIQQHRQQYHHYDPLGRFDGASSSRYNSQSQHGYDVGNRNDNDSGHRLRPQSPLRQSNVRPDSVPRRCMNEASGNNVTFGASSTTITKEDGVLLKAELAAFQKAAHMNRTIGAMVIKRQAAMINRQLLQLQQTEDQEEDESHGWSDNSVHVLNHDDEIGSGQSKRRRINKCTTGRSHARPSDDKRDTESMGEGIASQISLQEVTAIQASPTSNSSNNEPDNSYSHGSLVNTGADGTVSTASTNANTTKSKNFCQDKAAAQIWYQVDRMKRMSMFLKNAQIAQSLLYEEMKDCCYNYSTHSEDDVNEETLDNNKN